MKLVLLPAMLVAFTMLSGCAVENNDTHIQGVGLTYHSDIKKLDNGDYLAQVEAAPAAGRISGAVGAVNKKAADYCKAQNKAVKEIKTETDSHLLINGVARLTFRCI